MKTKHYRLFAIVLLLCFSWQSNAQQANKTPQSEKTTLRSYGLEKIDTQMVSKNSKDNKSFLSKCIISENKIKIFARPKGDINQLHQELKNLGIEDEKIRDTGITGYLPIDGVKKLDDCKFLKMAMPLHRPKVIDNKDLKKQLSEKTSSLASKFSAGSSQLSRNAANTSAGNFNTGTISEAVQVLRVDNVRDRMPDLKGTGVKIGIMSRSYNAIQSDLQAAVSRGDLPGAGNPNGYTNEVVVFSDPKAVNPDDFNFDSGRVMAELIHDIAPGAELFVYNPEDFFDMVDGIQVLELAGCNIIVEDINFDESPFFQDGLISQAFDNFVSNGGFHFAGVSGAKAHEADFTSGDFLLDGTPVNAHQFADGVSTFEFKIFPTSPFFGTIQWDDPSIFAGPNNPNPSTDIDLFLLDVNGDILASSEELNTLTGVPIESIFYQDLSSADITGPPVTLQLLVVKKSGPAPRIRLHSNFFNAGTIDDSIANFVSITGHHNGKKTIGVSSIVSFETPFFGIQTPSTSSVNAGGVPILLDNNGNRITPEVRQNPDFNSVDFVRAEGPFFTEIVSDDDPDSDPNSGGFEDLFKYYTFGNNVAAANLAAIAALALQVKPEITFDEMNTTFIKSAIDMDDTLTPDFDEGYDFGTGYGFIEADTFIENLSDTPSIYRYEAVNSQTDEVLFQIKSGDTIDLASVREGALLNIRALAANAESVRFKLVGSSNETRVENVEPYTVFGDTAPDYNDWAAPAKGNFRLTGQAFSNNAASGSASAPEIIEFKVRYSGEVSNYNVVSIQDPEVSFPLESQLDLAIVDEFFNEELDGQFDGSFTIQADIPEKLSDQFSIFLEGIQNSFSFNRKPIQVGKARFFLFGPESNINNDSAFPFSVFDDNETSPDFWESPRLGSYNLFSTLFARENDFLSRGESNNFKFDVIDSRRSHFGINNTRDEDISIYPNPAQNEVNISILENAKSLSIYDYSGKRIYNQNSSTSNKGVVTTGIDKEQLINVSEWNKGFYIIEVTDQKDNKYTKKLMVK